MIKMKIFVLALVMTIFCSSIAFGKPIESIMPILALKESHSVQNVNDFNSRGQIIALGILELSNNGNGEIGIYTQTLTHVPVDRVKVRVYLDILDKNKMEWQNVQYYDFDYEKEDNGGNGLSDPYEDFSVLGKSNNYYRLRSIHMVWKDGASETFNNETDGLLITK